VLLARLVLTSDEVASTSARSRKIELLAGLFATLDISEVEIAVGFLRGEPRQGRVGIGWASVYPLDVPPSSEPSLEIADVDRVVDEVRELVGPGSQLARREALTKLFSAATEREQDFLRRLFTGELRQGALEGVGAEAVAKAAGVPATLVRRAAMLDGDLGRVAYVAFDAGTDGLSAIGLRVGRAIKPMLASTAPSVAEALEGMDLGSVEWKLDGIRIQVHRDGDAVTIYTRNLNDITPALPGVADLARTFPADRFVLDGEAIGYAEDQPLAFQDTMSSLDAENIEGIASYFFDVLHVDGSDLIDEPLRTRLEALDRLTGKHRIPGVVTSDADVGQRVLDESLAAGHEGVVVKDASSLYVAGRRGKAWRKVKPHRTFDLVVIGVEWGHGRRKGRLSNLHLGARDPDGGEFVMVGKTFKGLTDELLEWQTNELLARETHREGIAVFVRPELVVEIALDGVQTSTRYPGGVALRFARVKRYRPDKNPDEADTIDSLRALLK
jgi:DNA ligase-1